MSLFKADRRLAGMGRRVLLRSTCDVADPQRPHEFEARQAADVLRVPLAQGRILRGLADERVLHDRITEVVHNSGDREDATEAVIQALLAHFFLPRSWSIASTNTLHR